MKRKPAKFLVGGEGYYTPEPQLPRHVGTTNPQAGMTGQTAQEYDYQGAPLPNVYKGMDWRKEMPNIVNPQGAIDYMRIVNASRNRGK
jgi:hypothetical protein